MKLSRRHLIYSVVGTGAALVGSGGIFVVTRIPKKALLAWNRIEDAPPADIRLDVFRYAILAPNPHNRQPWIIELVGNNEAIIYCDLERRLPETDPFDRQILIGFGCFLELARMAAAERSVRMDVKQFPKGTPDGRLDTRPIAHIRFIADNTIQKDSLFTFIPMRRSNKQPFDLNRSVDQTTLMMLVAQASSEAQASFASNEDTVKTLRTHTWDAWMVEFKTQRTWMETVNLMRIGKSEIEANPDGVSIGGPFLESLALAGQLSRDQIAKSGTTANKASEKKYLSILASGMAYIWITTNGNSRVDQLEAGRVYVRMNLEASRQGLGFHPISQALQEFPEMKKSFDAVQVTLNVTSGQRTQMLVRLGYAPLPATSPRWPVEAKLKGA